MKKLVCIGNKEYDDYLRDVFRDIRNKKPKATLLIGDFLPGENIKDFEMLGVNICALHVQTGIFFKKQHIYSVYEIYGKYEYIDYC